MKRKRNEKKGRKEGFVYPEENSYPVILSSSPIPVYVIFPSNLHLLFHRLKYLLIHFLLYLSIIF